MKRNDWKEPGSSDGCWYCVFELAGWGCMGCFSVFGLVALLLALIF